MLQRITKHPLVSSVILVGLAILTVVGFYLVGNYRESSARAASDVASYSELRLEYENAAYLPGAANNPVRHELNRALAELLTRKMPDAERIALAREGNDTLKELNQQIDAMTDLEIPLNESITRMERNAHVAFGFSTGGSEQAAIIALAKKEMEIVGDIRGLSYRANHETQKIFDRVIADKGKLTDAHLTALNDQIPEVEKQFDARTNLYTELQETSTALDKKLHRPGAAVLGVGE